MTPRDKMNEELEIIFNGKDVYRYYRESNPAAHIDDSLTVFFVDWFRNHSCNPNSLDRNGYEILIGDDPYWFYDMYALRDIKAGEEITTDYQIGLFDCTNLNFDCKCGSENCKKKIKAFIYLNEEQQNEILEYLKTEYEPYYLYLSEIRKG